MIGSNVRLDRLFDAVKGNVGLKQSALIKELNKLNKQLEQLEKNVQGLITLFSNQALTLEQFNAKINAIRKNNMSLPNAKRN
ncbi:hypothetical protein C7R92_16125 [Brevibacillus porteri]|uniref:Uncharacterized protein n=1 Tax=Brevibacillus porteri TaxID=2126350 RepID=A0ABX5FRJ6_9BACL|nr:hypothetical protein C7R92_16125 [Brevibacillus porteri]